MALVYMIKSNKEIKGSTVTSINYLEDDIQKVLIIIETYTVMFLKMTCTHTHTHTHKYSRIY